MRRTWATAAVLPVLAVLAAVALAGCGEREATPGVDASPAATAAADVPALPDGWRWESFGGVEMAVPGDWGWGSSSQRLGQWCVDDGYDGQPPPVVGRPGISTLVGCPEPEPGDPDPSTLVEHTGRIAAFDWALDGDRALRDEGDQGALRIGDVVIRVNAPADLREQILATAHAVAVDSFGCASRLPAGFQAGDPPEHARDVATITEVTGLAACRYSVVWPGSTDARPLLLSSIHLDGDEATDVVRAIQDAPLGGGPDTPSSCLPEVSYGDEMLLVRIEFDGGDSSLHAYYSGCDHNGFDDGVAVRSLTAASIRPLVTGGNAPTSWSGGREKARMLSPR